MKEVHIVIENGLVQEVYCDKDVNVIIYDLDSNYDDIPILRAELEELRKKYKTNQGVTYVDPCDFIEEGE